MIFFRWEFTHNDWTHDRLPHSTFLTCQSLHFKLEILEKFVLRKNLINFNRFSNSLPDSTIRSVNRKETNIKTSVCKEKEKKNLQVIWKDSVLWEKQSWILQNNLQIEFFFLMKYVGKYWFYFQRNYPISGAARFFHIGVPNFTKKYFTWT